MNRFTKKLFPTLFSLTFLLFVVIPTSSYANKEPVECVNKTVQRELPFQLSITDGLVTLHARGAQLGRILEDISEKTGVEFKIGPDVTGSISTSFHKLPIDEALKRMTGNRGIVFSKQKGKGRYQISKVSIFASSQNQAKTKAENHRLLKSRTGESKQFTPQITKTNSQVNQATSLTVLDEKTGTKSKVVSNELVIRFKKDLSKEDIGGLIAKSGAIVKTHIKALNYYVLLLPAHLSVNDALRWYRQQNMVDQAEPNYLIPLKVVPDDPDFSKQWALHNTGQAGGASDADIDAPEAWDVEKGLAEVVIAIIDTGVDYLHPDLAANIWHNPWEIPNNGLDDDGNGYIDDSIGWDFVDSFGGASDEDYQIADNDPMDRHGHGTHVAGIAGAVSNNGLGVAGVAWNCKIMAVRAGYKTPSGDGVLESVDAAQAIIYAAENGARVVNLSWGDYQKSNLIEDAMAFATSQGALVCAAAGNESSSTRIYPAASDNSAVMAVGATDSHDMKAAFSNYGDWVDVSAPGTGIYSTYPNNTYRQMSGTSMSAPHLAGLAALLFSHFPEISPLEVKTTIMRSVDVLNDLNGKNATSGRINSYLALSNQYTTPHIFSLSPAGAHEGDQITLFGDRFGAEQGNGFVAFYPDIRADIVSWDNSIILCTVPEGSQTGEVKVTTFEGVSNGIELTILTKLYDQALREHEFLNTGQPQGWQADDQSWLYSLPFSFPFFENQYDSVYVCSNGFLDFTNTTASYLNSNEAFKHRVMIAPMWDDLITNGSSQQGEDIYIHSPSPDSVCFRWAGERYETGDPVNAEVILFKDGRIQFNYGSGNSNLSPTVGISGGDEEKYHFASYNEMSSLNEVQTALFTPHKQTFTIALDLGWNLISLPLVPNNNRINEIMGSVISGIESVWGYVNGDWQVFIPENIEASNLESIKAGYGYWAKTNEEGLRIEVSGQTITTPFQLMPGWNLVGIGSLLSRPVEEALASIEGDIEIVWGYVDGLWQVYDPSNPEFSDFDKLDPEKGYWVSVR